MGRFIHPPETLIQFGKHVFVDITDGEMYTSEVHDPFRAIAELLKDKFVGRARKDEQFMHRCEFDLITESLRERFDGHQMHVMGDVPDGYFEEDELPEDYRTVGPFYFFRGCMCVKNMDASVIATRDMLREKEKTEDLSAIEEKIALHFHTHILTLAGHEPIHDHVD